MYMLYVSEWKATKNIHIVTCNCMNVCENCNELEGNADPVLTGFLYFSPIFSNTNECFPTI